MTRRSGSANLPLHRGRVPPWLADRMARLGRVLTEALVLEYGCHEFLRRLGDPFWFQSLGCVMGMDWHSSGITTSVMGALKKGLEPVGRELGISICGGRGKHSRKTPAELLQVGERTGLDGEILGRTSRLVAKVDSAAIQDGFDLYLHSFVVADDGAWTVVQQGMHTARRQARRYHWMSEGLESFVDSPHSGIEGPSQGKIVNLTDSQAGNARQAQVNIVRHGPDYLLGELHRLRHLQLPAHHDVKMSDVMLRRLRATITAASDNAINDFSEWLLTSGVGARTVQALALVGEVVHGAPCRFDDPARFAFAHGGKDGHPFPVPLKVYDQTLQVLRRAVDQAKLGRKEKLDALRRLGDQSRLLERAGEGLSFEEILHRERSSSSSYGGRTVYGPARESAPPPKEAPQSSPPPQSSPRPRTPKPPKEDAPPARKGQLTLPGFGSTSRRGSGK